jgi:hypothetical protein
VEARVQALLEDADNNPPGRIRLCDIKKVIHFLKLRKACGMDDIPNKCLKTPSEETIGTSNTFC